MSSHTPGPWSVDKYGDVIANGEDIARIASGYGYEEADARLIAAAPELLEALKQAIECGMVPISSAREGGACAYVRHAQVADMVRDAIAKATGGDQ